MAYTLSAAGVLDMGPLAGRPAGWQRELARELEARGITELNMVGQRMGSPIDTVILANELHNHPTLRRLVCVGAGIDQDAIVRLVMNPKLEHLDARSIHISASRALAMTSLILRPESGLKSLYVSYPACDLASIIGLIGDPRCRLVEFNLHIECVIGPSAETSFFDALRSNFTLTKVFGLHGAQAIVDQNQLIMLKRRLRCRRVICALLGIMSRKRSPHISRFIDRDIGRLIGRHIWQLNRAEEWCPPSAAGTKRGRQ